MIETYLAATVSAVPEMVMELDAGGSSLISLILLATLFWQAWWAIGHMNRDNENDHDNQSAATLPLVPHETPPLPTSVAHDTLRQANLTEHQHHDDVDAIAILRANNPGFEISAFLDGAQTAYETIVTAFLEGDWPALKPLVAPDVQDVFLRTIEVREKSGKNADANLIHLAPPEVTHVGIVNGHAEISVRFVGEWLTVPRAGNSDGDDSSISIRTSDEWIFARALQTRDPTWLVTATN